MGATLRLLFAMGPFGVLLMITSIVMTVGTIGAAVAASTLILSA